jgi:hypothetical protein
MYSAEKFLHGAALDTSLEFVSRNDLLAFLRDIVWKLYEENKNDPIVQIRKWGIRWTLKVHHIRPLLIRWFGEP